MKAEHLGGDRYRVRRTDSGQTRNVTTRTRNHDTESVGEHMTDHDGAPLRVLPTAIAAATPEVPMPRSMDGQRCEVGETHQLLDDGEPYVSEEQRWTDEVMALANERRDANKIARDLTACRSELASIALLMQERNQLPDQGGDNFALVSGAVTTYVLALELGVVALNEDRQDLVNGLAGFQVSGPTESVDIELFCTRMACHWGCDVDSANLAHLAEMARNHVREAHG